MSGVTSRPGVSTACRISRSPSSGISELYGLKTFAKYSASTFAFCTSLLPISSLVLSGEWVFVTAVVYWWLSIASIAWLPWLTSFPNKFEWPFVFGRLGAISARSMSCLVLRYLAVTWCFATIFLTVPFLRFSFESSVHISPR